MRKYNRTRSLSLLIGWLLVFHAPAKATQFEIYGGPGGNNFTALCWPDYYLVGLEGRTGQWIDRMAPICGSWSKERQGFVNSINLAFVGKSNGGTPAAAVYPHGYGLKQWTYGSQ